jgi:hypothetical protein
VCLGIRIPWAPLIVCDTGLAGIVVFHVGWIELDATIKASVDHLSSSYFAANHGSLRESSKTLVYTKRMRTAVYGFLGVPVGFCVSALVSDSKNF